LTLRTSDCNLNFTLHSPATLGRRHAGKKEEGRTPKEEEDRKEEEEVVSGLNR
jgi:hypothetical protein